MAIPDDVLLRADALDRANTNSLDSFGRAIVSTIVTVVASIAVRVFALSYFWPYLALTAISFFAAKLHSSHSKATQLIEEICGRTLPTTLVDRQEPSSEGSTSYLMGPDCYVTLYNGPISEETKEAVVVPVRYQFQNVKLQPPIYGYRQIEKQHVFVYQDSRNISYSADPDKYKAYNQAIFGGILQAAKEKAITKITFKADSTEVLSGPTGLATITQILKDAVSAQKEHFKEVKLALPPEVPHNSLNRS